MYQVQTAKSMTKINYEDYNEISPTSSDLDKIHAQFRTDQATVVGVALTIYPVSISFGRS